MATIKYLVLLIFAFVSSEGKKEIIDESEAWEKEVDIDVDSCGVTNYHDYYDECTAGVHPNDIDKYPSIPPCCGPLAYAAIGECDGTDKNDKKYTVENVHVCHDLNNGEKFLKPDFGCPKKCTLEKSIVLDQNLTRIKQLDSGSYIIKENGHGFNNYCLSYNCEHSGEDMYGWELAADICKCPDEDILEILNKELKDINTPNVPPCCDIENEIFKKNPQKSNGKRYACQSKNDTTISSKKAFKCNDKTKFNEIEILGKTKVQENLKKINDEDLDVNDACVGVLSHDSILEISMLTCQPICSNHTPCFRYCCGKGEYYDRGECKKNSSTIPKKEIAFEALESLTDDNKEFNTWNDECNSEEEMKQLTCAGVDILPSGSLWIRDGNSNGDLTLNYGKFCVTNQIPTERKGHYFFQACMPKKTKKSKLTFYPIILCVSAGFLLTTVMIYLLFPPLINHYSKIMMNFSTSLFFAFLVLIAAQKPDWFPDSFLKEDKEKMWPFPTCVVLAFLNQYFFLAAFTWMTIMSYAIFNQLKGLNYGKAEKGIIKQLIAGYGIPFLICLVTAIVEFTAPMCASYRPKFGHKECLFHGGIDKFIWFLGPILVMLLMNTGMFIYVFTTIFRTSMISEQHTGSHGKEKLDKACLYLRLFLGMGITWYFEIISWAIPGEQEWYFTDILNIFQGIYVFLIFVCKRNVLKVVLKKRDKLYSTVRRNTGDSGARARLKMLSETSRDAQDKTDAFTENVTVSYRFSQLPDDDETKI